MFSIVNVKFINVFFIDKFYRLIRSASEGTQLVLKNGLTTTMHDWVWNIFRLMSRGEQIICYVSPGKPFGPKSKPKLTKWYNLILTENSTQNWCGYILNSKKLPLKYHHLVIMIYINFFIMQFVFLLVESGLNEMITDVLFRI